MSSPTSLATRTPATAASRWAALVRARRLGMRLLFCVVAAFMSLVSKPAAAVVFAPMCGEHGETIAAPPISRAAKEVPLAPTGCEDHRDPRFENRQPKPAPLPVTAFDWIPRLPPVRYRLPPPPRVLTPAESTCFDGRDGHARGIERPPR